MFDASLNFAFFSRDHNRNIIGMNSNLGWHNESKGVMMINHYYKENVDFDQMISKFGDELLQMEENIEFKNERNKDITS